MTEKEREQIIKFLKSNGWDENRCVDTSIFRYELMDDPDNEFLGSKFSQFETAKRFLSNFGGLHFEWQHPNNNYEFEMTFDGRVGTRVMYLKWYIAYFRCMLYPVGEYLALPGELFIDEQGYFYIAQDTFVRKLGNDIFEILYDFIFLNKKRVYKKITDWEDAGYSDEFMEQWNYDFDELDRMKNDNT